MSKRRGPLILIGTSNNVIRKEVAQLALGGGGRLVVMTVPTQSPDEVGDDYRELFGELGVSEVEVVDVRTISEANEPERVARLDQAAVIFLVGGDQLRITSQLGNSKLMRRIYELHEGGTAIVGISAGAAAMSETMLISGPSDKSPSLDEVGMAPGLGLIEDVIVDTHFTERGRIARLLSALALNPRQLGIGIDENTAIVVRNNKLRVLGSGAVYILDGTPITYSSLTDRPGERVLSIFDIRMHVLASGDEFDLAERRPSSRPQAETAED
jgi:cyanophycinase